MKTELTYDSHVSLNLHRQYLKQRLQLLFPPSTPHQELPKQRSHSSNTNRRKSGATKDSNESMQSSRSGKGITSKLNRDKDEISQTSRSSKNRQLDVLGEIKEHETTSIPEEAETKEPDIVPLDPRILEIQSEIDNLSSTHQSLPPLLDTSFEKDIYHDPLFPIREREFMELLIRIIAEVTCRRPGGLSSGGLFDSVYRTFAEIVSAFSCYRLLILLIVGATCLRKSGYACLQCCFILGECSVDLT